MKSYWSVALIASTAARAAFRWLSEMSSAKAAPENASAAAAASIMEMRRARWAKIMADRTPVLTGSVAGLDTIGARDDDHGRQPQKQTMLDDAGNGVESFGKRSCIRNAAKRCIEDQMSTVCNKRFAIRHPQCQRAFKAKPGGGARYRQFSRFQPESVDLDRQRETAQHVDQLGLVGNNDHP